MIIDPFELHPDTPYLDKMADDESVTVGQVKEIVNSLAIRMWSGPNKIWGHSRVDMEHWLRMVVVEAEKIVSNDGD